MGSTRPSSTPGRSNCSLGPTRSSATGPRPGPATPKPRRPNCSSRSAASRWNWSGSKKKSARSPELLRRMGLEAIYPKPKLSAAGRGHRVYPYLLRDVKIERPDQVWSTDITSGPLARGFLYLAATIDGYSRYVIAWRLSNTLDGSF